MVHLLSRGWKVTQSSATDVAFAKQDTKRGSSDVSATSSRRETWWTWRRRRFSSIGWGYSILMILIFCLSSVWSLLLITLNLDPSKSANYVLQTESLDHGHFWQSRKTPLSIQISTTTLLIIIVGVYWYLLYLLLIRPPSRRVRLEVLKSKRQTSKIIEQRQPENLFMRLLRGITSIITKVFHSVILTDDKYRKEWNVIMEIPEIVLQIFALQEHMAQGLDMSLLYCYASLMAVNAFVVFYHTQFRWNEAAIHHIIKDSVLDAAFAVFFPALTLFYSLFSFQDDLTTVKIRQRFFPPRIFDRKARNYVSAKELNMFSTDFESLLIHNGWDMFLKLSFSLLACVRWTRITAVLLKRERRNPRSTRNILSTRQTTTGCMTMSMNNLTKPVAPLIAANTMRHQSGKLAQNVLPEHSLRSGLRKAIGFSFLVFGIGCIVYTAVAVQVSRASCLSYPECVQYVYQWTSNNACACLVYVDRDMAPANSENLTDITQRLADLASAGKLQTVQLVNRKINGSLPDDLRTCRDLRNLVLIHTGVEVFPSWTSASFSQLEYLHVEGVSTDINLIQLPSDLFFSMASLHTIHLSYHASLPSLPSLFGLKSLESVYFGYLDEITELPLMGELQSIQVIALEGLLQVRALPNVELYTDTLEIMFVQNTPVCCSGFLSEGVCNTTFLNCCVDDSNDSSSGNPLPSTCLIIPDENSLLPTTKTRSSLARFAANVSNFCDPTQAKCPSVYMVKSIWLQEDVCAGVLYRDCSSEFEGAGICFSEDMNTVQCVYSQTIIDMRKTEIAAGCSCDNVEEQWLGCA